MGVLLTPPSFNYYKCNIVNDPSTRNEKSTHFITLPLEFSIIVLVVVWMNKLYASLKTLSQKI